MDCSSKMNLNCMCMLDDTQITFVFEGKQKKTAMTLGKNAQGEISYRLLFLKEEKNSIILIYPLKNFIEV